jgi:hypothetical protein
LDVVEYPDSGKVGAVVGDYPERKRFMFRAAMQVGYFDGEPER